MVAAMTARSFSSVLIDVAVGLHPLNNVRLTLRGIQLPPALTWLIDNCCP